MVAVQNKSESSTSSSVLSLAPKKESQESRGSISFSELLHGASLKKDEKAVQNGTYVLALNNTKENVKSPLDRENSTKSDQSQRVLSLLQSKKENGAQESQVQQSESKSLQIQERQKVPSSLSEVVLKKDEKVIELTKFKLSPSDIKENVNTPTSSLKSEKPETLLSLLQLNQENERSESQAREGNKKEVSVLGLNPQVAQKISSSELRELISDAKAYLKDKINATQVLSKTELESLPKTLKGLIQVAQKLGIEVSKIRLESVQKNASVNSDSIKSTSPQTQELKKGDDSMDEMPSKPKQTHNTHDAVIEKKSTKPLTLKEEVNKQESTKQEVLKQEPIRQEPLKQEPTKQEALKQEPTKQEVLKQEPIRQEPLKQEPTKQEALKQEPIRQEPLKQEPTKQEVLKQEPIRQEPLKQDLKETHAKVQETPLFKAHTKTEISTEEIVNTKSSVSEARKPKERVEDRLSMLLQGEKASKSDAGSTTISLATSKVLLQSEIPKEASPSKGFESLLYGQKEESPQALKLDATGAPKVESLEVKINEAKQMMRYLSGDIKAAIEDYKSPFTRVKVQLNPQRLGEIDLTVVQRGKNLHVTLSSNNAAVNTLAMNVNDLKVQLTNSGIQNATLNFSNTGQDGTASQQQQQQNSHQQHQRANQEYNYFENEEAGEEILASLEIVVPSYA